MKTIDELLEEILAESNQDSSCKVETDVKEDEFFQLTLEERFDLLPF